MAPLFAYGAAALAALVGGIVLVVKKHRATGIGLILVGSFLILLPAGIAVMWFTPLGNPTSMQVEPLDPPNDPWFTVDLRHARYFDDGVEYTFGQAGDPERVARVFQDQHPASVVSTADPARMGRNGESIWHLSTDSVRYELMHHTEDGTDFYGLVTQLVVVHESGSGPDVRIPFPRSAFNVTGVDEGEPYANAWSPEQWADFYKDISLTHAAGDTITVPTNRGGTATIVLGDDTATVTVND